MKALQRLAPRNHSTAQRQHPVRQQSDKPSGTHTSPASGDLWRASCLGKPVRTQHPAGAASSQDAARHMQHAATAPRSAHGSWTIFAIMCIIRQRNAKRCKYQHRQVNHDYKAKLLGTKHPPSDLRVDACLAVLLQQWQAGCPVARLSWALPLLPSFELGHSMHVVSSAEETKWHCRRYCCCARTIPTGKAGTCAGRPYKTSPAVEDDGCCRPWCTLGGPTLSG